MKEAEGLRTQTRKLKLMGQCIKCGTKFIGTAANPPKDGLCRYCERDEMKYQLEVAKSRIAILEARPSIDKLVDAFLTWPLPESVCSDQCATIPGHASRTGTNLLTATEARQMFEHVLASALLEKKGT